MAFVATTYSPRVRVCRSLRVVQFVVNRVVQWCSLSHSALVTKINSCHTSKNLGIFSLKCWEFLDFNAHVNTILSTCLTCIWTWPAQVLNKIKSSNHGQSTMRMFMLWCYPLFSFVLYRIRKSLVSFECPHGANVVLDCLLVCLHRVSFWLFSRVTWRVFIQDKKWSPLWESGTCSKLDWLNWALFS